MDDLLSYFRDIGSGTLIIVLFIFMNQSAQEDVFSQISSNDQAKTRFRKVFENIEESIVIMEGQRGKYANNSFLIKFQKHIKDSEVEIQKTVKKQGWLGRLIC